MATPPIRIRLNPYSGRDRRKIAERDKQRQIAHELERYINELVEKQTTEAQVYLYSEIARGTRYPVNLVAEICSGIPGGGHNGFTVYKPENKGKQP
jgi:hypothetical protein